MEYLVGIGLAVAVCAFAWVSGFDRDRAFYPTVLIVVAHYYILFAAMAGSSRALLVESLLAGIFLAVSVVGFKKSFWLVAAGLVGHGIFDLFHPGFVQNPGVPVWWPDFCMAFDVAAGALLALLLMRRSGFAAEVSRSR
jgi:hypothetical protein